MCFSVGRVTSIGSVGGVSALVLLLVGVGASWSVGWILFVEY